MNGITIVEEHLCRVVELPSLIGIGIFMSLLIVGVLALYRLAYKNSTKDKSTKILTWCCSIFLVILYIATWGHQICMYNKTHMEYTVTIDDSVSFNDFHAKYEIVSVTGNKYRVLEK